MNLQNRNKLTDFENKLMVTKGERWGGGSIRRFGLTYTYTYAYIYIHMHICVQLSAVSNSATLWTVGHQAPLTMAFPRPRILEWVAISSFRGSSKPRD